LFIEQTARSIDIHGNLRIGLLIGYSITGDLKFISAKTNATVTERYQMHATGLSLGGIFYVHQQIISEI
jgi:hypothetical protein